MSDLFVVRGDSICDRLLAFATSLQTVATAGPPRAVAIELTATDVLGFVAVFSCAEVDGELMAFTTRELAAWWRSLSAGLVSMAAALRAGDPFRDLRVTITIPHEDCAPLSASIRPISERLAARVAAAGAAPAVPS